MLIANHNLQDDVERVMIDAPTVQARVQELAQEIDTFYADKDDLLLICVLKGAFVFLSDLSRAIARPHEVDFMAISSYGSGTTSSGVVQILLDLRQSIENRHVLIVEDIIDSGHTLDYMMRVLQVRKPASLRIVTLLNKPSRRTVDVPVAHIGFDIEDEFVVGYGLDFAEEYRNLPEICVLKPHIFEHLFTTP